MNVVDSGSDGGHSLPVSPDEIRAEVELICSHSSFSRSLILRRFLCFTVFETLEGRGGELKEYAIALSALGKGVDFDPRHSSVVRTQARNLRARLAEYYSQNPDAIRITYSPGGYIPVFSRSSDRSGGSPAPQHWVTRPPQWDRTCTRARALSRTGNPGDLTEAMAVLSELIASAPEYGPACAVLSLCLSLRQDAVLTAGAETRARAKALAMQAVALSPDSAEAWASLGWVRITVDGDPRSGQECLETAASLDPSDGLPLALLGCGCHLRRGESDEAEKLLEHALLLSPDDAAVRFLRAWLLFCLHRYEASLDQLDSFAPDAEPPAIADLRPWLLAFLGRESDALSASFQMPHGGEWLRAWLEARQGKPNRAGNLVNLYREGAVTGEELPDLFAIVLMAELGETEEARGLLTRAVRRHHPHALYSGQDPRLENL